MTNWHKVKLKDLVTFRTGKLDSNAMEQDGKYPFFTCAPETFKINSYSFDTTAILLAGNNAKGIFPIKFYSGKFNCYQRTYVIENIDENVADLRFIYFSIKVQLDFLRNMSVGATTKFLTIGMLENLIISIPSLQNQKKIAKILSNYDDLIELNLEKIKLLKESLKLTYEEWFLRFKVDGLKLDIDPDTNVPIGWKNVFLVDYVDLLRGVEPGSSQYKDIETDSNIPFIRVGDLSKRSSNIYVSKDLANNKIINNDDILLSLDGTPGMVNFGLSGCYSTGIRKAVSKQKNLSSVFIYNLLNSPYIQGLIAAHSSGATILHAGSSVKKMKFVLPKDEVLDKYNDAESKKFQLILNFLDQNKLLNEARDLLLPRMITGMINTDEMDIAI